MPSAPPDFSQLSCSLLGNGSWGKNISASLQRLSVGHLRVGGEVPPPNLSAVFIATPLTTHAKMALPFVERGIPVFIEKPLVATRAEGLALVRAWWGSKAPLLCDFQHLFSQGFEALYKEYELRSPSRVSFIATLGGPGPVRADCHPVWDYGSHLVSMALRLGLKDALMNAHLLFDSKTGIWTIEASDENHHIELNVSNKLPDKVRRASIAFGDDHAASYSEPMWLVHREHGPNAGSIERHSNEESPPLMRALKHFLIRLLQDETVLGAPFDGRFGLSLPMDVDAVLRRLMEP